MLSYLLGAGVGGTGPVYLVPFVAPPSAHPVGPHRREEGQVIAIGLRQEHRLPRVQGEAGAGVPLLRERGATHRVEEVTGWACRLCQARCPAHCPWALYAPPGPWLRGLYGRQKSHMGLPGLNSRSQQGWLLLEAPGRMFSLYFTAFRGSPHSLVTALAID